jgi:electron transfer flavoprotein alpha subunit
MTDTRKRLDPRRPFVLTQAGLRRITLGATGAFDASLLTAQAHKAGPKALRLSQAPTGFLLVAAHSQRGMLDAHAYQAVAAAALLAGPERAVIVLVFGALNEDLREYGADLVAALPAAGEESWAPEQELAWLCEFVTRYAPCHVIMPDNEIGDGDLGRRLAARLEAGIATHVVELKPGAVAMYWQSGAELARGAMPLIVLIAPETVETSLPFCGAAERLDYRAAPVPPGPYQNCGLREIAASSLALEEADFIVAAGNGVQDVPTFEAVAAAFGAAVGASRVAVDEGKFTRDKQIGATGKTVNASVYMAVGISGAVQHLQGIKACRHVIVVNHDASAPITKRADLTIVGDAQEVMTALLAELTQRNWQDNARQSA